MADSPKKSCCGGNEAEDSAQSGPGCCGGSKNRIDWLLWGSLVAVAIGFTAHHTGGGPEWWRTYAHGTHEFMSNAWWGIIVGIAAVAIIGRFPNELIAAVLGRGGTISGILRATFAGVQPQVLVVSWLMNL